MDGVVLDAVASDDRAFDDWAAVLPMGVWIGGVCGTVAFDDDVPAVRLLRVRIGGGGGGGTVEVPFDDDDVLAVRLLRICAGGGGSVARADTPFADAAAGRVTGERIGGGGSVARADRPFAHAATGRVTGERIGGGGRVDLSRPI